MLLRRAVTLTIQWTPNLSVTMPNVSPRTASRAHVNLAPRPSLVKISVSLLCLTSYAHVDIVAELHFWLGCPSLAIRERASFFKAACTISPCP